MLVIKAEPTAGSNLPESIHEGIEIAKKLDCMVEIRINCTMLAVTKDSDPSRIEREFEQKREH